MNKLRIKNKSVKTTNSRAKNQITQLSKQTPSIPPSIRIEFIVESMNNPKQDTAEYVTER
ncbi:MAG: hypothetical protein WCS89_02215 [Candidatus Paceibacterota bacterium]